MRTVKDFAWDSSKWWTWFTAHRRRPSIATLRRHLQSYSGFIVFHGCRPLDVSSYYSSGLRASDLDSLNEVARRIFLSPDLPPVTERAFGAAIDSVSRLDHGKLYVVLDERDLLRYCGHYMIYGSEHLCGIGASLTREHGFDYRQALKRFGTPTVVRFRLPHSSVPERQIDDLARHLHEVTWEDRHGQTSPPLVSWSFILSDPIPPEHILGHTHPQVIPDPLFHNIPYRYQHEVA